MKDLFRRQHAWSWPESLFWVLALAVFFLFPTHLVLAAQILITGLFALSVDLLVGYAGVITLGHAAFFGIGAYAAGLLSKYGWSEPITGLLGGGVLAGVAGLAVSAIALRGQDLTRLMVTLGIGLALFELANRLTWLTGGMDGLQGMNVSPLLGHFAFDLYGKTAYLYVLVVVFLLFCCARALVRSPFGLSLRGIRENPARSAALGVPIRARLTAVYCLSATFAGVAGALLAQTTQSVALDSISFERSADVLVMLIVGGTGTLYGGFIGALGYMLLQDRLAQINPQYWMAGIGLLLILTVLFLRHGILGGLASWRARLARGRGRP